MNGEKDLLSGGMDSGLVSATFPTTSMGSSNPNLSTAETSGNGADEYDMFAEDDENATAKPSTDENNAISQPSSDVLNSDSEGKVFNLLQEICHLKWISLLQLFI